MLLMTLKNYFLLEKGVHSIVGEMAREMGRERGGGGARARVCGKKHQRLRGSHGALKEFFMAMKGCKKLMSTFSMQGS